MCTGCVFYRALIIGNGVLKSVDCNMLCMVLSCKITQLGDWSISKCYREVFKFYKFYIQCTHTVPSGYILTPVELQVLSGLLATYSNEKLNEIQQSIEKQQKLSREQVESALKESGLPQAADDLKDNIEKGLCISHNY